VNELYPELEICCLDQEDLKCRLFAIYRAPSSNDMPRLLECLSAYSDINYNCIIVGDLNCPNVDWSTLTAKADGVQDELLNFTVIRGFSQVVQSATRADNLLDIVLTSEPLSICDIDVIQPFDSSDHSQVICSLFYDCTDVVVLVVTVVDRVKDLGVIIDSHLTFTHHIDQIVARAFTC